MEYEPTKVNEIKAWLEKNAPGGIVEFDASDGIFIVKPNGEPYLIEIPYLEAVRIVATNGEDVSDKKWDKMVEYAMDQEQDENNEDECYDS